MLLFYTLRHSFRHEVDQRGCQAPFTRYNLLSNRFDKRLYRVNGVSVIGRVVFLSPSVTYRTQESGFVSVM